MKRYDPPALPNERLFAPAALDWSDGEWAARIIDTPTAKRWLNQYHYLGGTHAVWSYGVYCPDLIAVVSLGQPANRNGVASKYGLQPWPGNHEITRVGVHPEGPKNTASRAIALVAREYARRGHEWVFSYADTGQGHHGGIYQALNAVYVGLSPARSALVVDGAPVHVRTLANRYRCDGTELLDRLRADGHEVVRVSDGRSAKHTYVLPIGNRASRAAIRKHLGAYALPYPKR